MTSISLLDGLIKISDGSLLKRVVLANLPQDKVVDLGVFLEEMCIIHVIRVQYSNFGCCPIEQSSDRQEV